MATRTRNPRPEWLPSRGVLGPVPAGIWWDAVTVEGTLGQALAERVSSSTADGSPGPMLCDPRGPVPKVYFLVPQGTATRWDEPGTEALGECCYVGIPGDLDPDPSTVHWLAPPTAPVPDLVRPELLLTLLGELRAAS
jgi:hypothetical protein